VKAAREPLARLLRESDSFLFFYVNRFGQICSRRNGLTMLLLHRGAVSFLMPVGAGDTWDSVDMRMGEKKPYLPVLSYGIDHCRKLMYP
jgi:hypothetical protein